MLHLKLTTVTDPVLLKIHRGPNPYVGIYLDDREVGGTVTYGDKELILQWLSISGGPERAQIIWDAYERGELPQESEFEAQERAEKKRRDEILSKYGQTERGRKVLSMLVMKLRGEDTTEIETELGLK